MGSDLPSRHQVALWPLKGCFLFSKLAVALESFDGSSLEFLFPDGLPVDHRDDLRCPHQ